MSSYLSITENTTELKEFDRFTELKVLTNIKKDAMRLDGFECYAWKIDLLECNSLDSLFSEWGISKLDNQLTSLGDIYNSALIPVIFQNLAPILTEGYISMFNESYNEIGDLFVYENGKCYVR